MQGQQVCAVRKRGRPDEARRTADDLVKGLLKPAFDLVRAPLVRLGRLRCNKRRSSCVDLHALCSRRLWGRPKLGVDLGEDAELALFEEAVYAFALESEDLLEGLVALAVLALAGARVGEVLERAGRVGVVELVGRVLGRARGGGKSVSRRCGVGIARLHGEARRERERGGETDGLR